MLVSWSGLEAHHIVGYMEILVFFLKPVEIERNCNILEAVFGIENSAKSHVLRTVNVFNHLAHMFPSVWLFLSTVLLLLWFLLLLS